MLHYILGGTDYVNDFALNRFEPYRDGARLAGVGLFREGVYTGVDLDNDQTLLANLLYGVSGKIQLLVGDGDADRYSALVMHSRRKFKVIATGMAITRIEIHLNLDVKLVEEGVQIQKHANRMLHEVEARIADDLSSKANDLISTLQQADCDYLQIGHELAAYHPKLFHNNDWRKQYTQLLIKPVVKVRIINTGILET